MNAIFARINSLLSRHVPEQRIYLRTETTTRYFRATPLMQTLFGGVVAVGFCWTVIATSALMLDRMSAQSGRTQAEVLQRAYETRLNEISSERDQRALEAQTAQERFYIALEQISLQQNDLLGAEEERRELATGLKIMQQKLQKAVSERDVAQKSSDSILAEMQAITGSLNTRLGGARDTEETLTYLTRALDDTVNERDEMRGETEVLYDQMSKMTMTARLRQEQNDRIFVRLEQAVELSLSPLERALKRTGVDTEKLLNEVRRGYSGTGGPLMPLVISSKGSGVNPLSNRSNLLLTALDKVGLMQLATQKLPLMVPVRGSYRNTSGYGFRRDPKTGGRRLHKGSDMAGRRGTPIVAPGDGVVTFAGRQSGYGNLVKVRHAAGLETFFAHLNRIAVKAGQRVSRGDRIGDMGTTGRSTGVHLHYEIRKNGKPINPMIYMKAAQNVF
ncbi:MAG: peptidoglycan DD-metalloendopeptidase family protein [Rhodobacteraceae bacterium]|nr:peptidoglycan DD-metalloendopeptidase family protein [Paracoccaceae bacterium]